MPNEVLEFLIDLMQLPGLPGFEAPVRECIRRQWEPLADEISVSRLGNLYAHKHGTAAEPRPSVLLTAHMDAIGLMVVDIVEGLLRIAAVGGVDKRVLPSQPVTVHGRTDLPGIIVQPPYHCLPEPHPEGPFPLKYLMVDLGLPPETVERSVRAGDLISFAQAPVKLKDELLIGPALDNRASVVALTIALQALQTREHAWDVVAAGTVQEEEQSAGGRTAGFTIRPSMAIVVDATYGRSHGLDEHESFPLGEGITNGWGPEIHPGVYHALQTTAEREEIPITDEILPTRTGTEASAIQIAKEGIPTGVISIPVRYMHTPTEIVSLKDIHHAGLLLAAFVSNLAPDFMDGLTWD